jgi:dolichol-phosphate mannosyltransferase
MTEELDLVVTRGPHPVHVRVRAGLKKSKNWRQLAKFCIVGGSGYVVNLLVFALCVGPLNMHHIAAATVAFVAGVTNNFWWNRHWTFRAGAGRAESQAPRFFAVSVVAFLFALGVLELLVSVFDVAELPAQAVAIIAATPLNFIGNKMWSFAIEVSRD